MTSDEIKFALGFIRLCRLFRETCKSVRTHFNLSENEMRLLITVYHLKPDTIKKISKELSLSPSLTSKVLSSLEKKELLYRQLNLDDKRFEAVFLTEKGMRTTSLIIEFINKTFCEKVTNSLAVQPEFIKSFSEQVIRNVRSNKKQFILIK